MSGNALPKWWEWPLIILMLIRDKVTGRGK